MPLVEAGIVISSVAGSKFVESVTQEIINGSRSLLREHKIKKINRLAFKTIFRKLKSVEMVNTIWRTTDDPVNLRDFYYPSKLNIQGLREKVTAETIDEISEDENIIIEGTAGQGKSIFLRNLASNEIRKGLRIPLFIELRKLGQSESIIPLIEKKFDSLGFITSKEIIDALLKSGKILLLFDGFDEVHSTIKSETLKDIEHISEKYEKTQIAITSRPGSGIQGSTNFRIVRIAPISSAEYNGLLNKICTSKQQAESIELAISKSNISVKRVLTTPLLLTLLTLLYKTEQAIPENLIDFYDKLFYVLFSRHDNTKPGFEREIKSRLSENRFEEVFEAFCFLSRKAQKTSLTRRYALALTKESLEIAQQNCEEPNFIDDCCKVACLLIQEGFDYHFIHKSVQEFYAAQFISKRTDEFVKKFYTHALDNYSAWSQEIDFLETLDQFRASQYFKLPAIREARTKIDEEGPKYILSGSHFIINKDHIISGFAHPNSKTIISYYSNKLPASVYDKAITSQFMGAKNAIDKEAYDLALQHRDKSFIKVNKSDQEPQSFIIDTVTFLELTKRKDTLERVVNLTLNLLDRDEEATNKIIENENKLKDMEF